MPGISSYIYGVISGILQGATEFLPVSSSGHLVLLRDLFGYREPEILFNVVLHIGTLLSVILFFRQEIYRIFKTDDKILAGKIFFAFLITGIIGLIFQNFFRGMFVNLSFLGLSFAVTALLLFAAHRLLGNRPEGVDTITWRTAAVIGLAQAVAIVPGISRSGITIVTALFMGVSREKAFVFSFLLSIPSVLGALVLETENTADFSFVNIGQYAVGFLFSLTVGLFALHLFRETLMKKRLHLFAIYCLVLGVLTVLYTAFIR